MRSAPSHLILFLLQPGNIPLWALRGFHFFSGSSKISHLCLFGEEENPPASFSDHGDERELCPSCCERPQALPAAGSYGLLATRSPGKLHSCTITSLYLRCCGTRTACCGGSWKRCVFSCGRRAGPSEGCQLQVKCRRVCCISILTKSKVFWWWGFHGSVEWLVVPEPLLLLFLALGSLGRKEGSDGW